MVLLFALAIPAGARAQLARRSCDRTASTVITFGTDGGNMRPLHVTVDADGQVTREGDAPGERSQLARLEPAARRTLVERAWQATLPAHSMSASRPLSTRDAAYRFVELTAACAHRRSEWQDDAPARFRALYARLLSAAGLSPR